MDQLHAQEHRQRQPRRAHVFARRAALASSKVEVTDKNSINVRAVLQHRAALVELLYASDPQDPGSCCRSAAAKEPAMKIAFPRRPRHRWWLRPPVRPVALNWPPRAPKVAVLDINAAGARAWQFRDGVACPW